MELILIPAIRLIVPLLILRFPLAGTLLSALLDAIDFGYLGNRNWYQSLDKILDTYYLGLCVIVAWRWQDILAKRIAIGLYLFRLIGVLVFLVIQHEWILFFFPNLFESFFVFYLLFVRLSGHAIMLTRLRVTIGIFIVLLVPRLIEEYTIHVYRPGAEHQMGWLGIVFVMPKLLAVLLWLVPPAILLGAMIWHVKKTN